MVLSFGEKNPIPKQVPLFTVNVENADKDGDGQISRVERDWVVLKWIHPFIVYTIFLLTPTPLILDYFILRIFINFLELNNFVPPPSL